MALKNNLNLERAVLIKIATQLWQHIHRLEVFVEEYGDGPKTWHLLEITCIENVETLLLPNALSEKIKKIIKPIGIEILKFNQCRLQRVTGSNHIKQKPVNMFWTAQGTVDTKRTYKALIDDESLDLSFRYRLAYYCCLEEDISFLWDQMPEKQKCNFASFRFHSELNDICFFNKGNQMVVRNEEEVSRIYKYSFFQSLMEYNKEAVEFFWNKLSIEVRRFVLPKALAYLNFHIHSCVKGGCLYNICDCTQVVLFLLSQSDKESLGKLKQISSFVALLDWPYQDYWLEITNSTNLTGQNVDRRLARSKLLNKIYFGFQDYDYALLLKILLKQQMSLLGQQCNRLISPPRFEIFSRFRDDCETFSLIDSYCQRVLQIDVESSQDIFENLSDDQEWEFLAFIIDECILKSKRKIFQSGFKVPSARTSYGYSKIDDMCEIDKICNFLKDVTRT